VGKFGHGHSEKTPFFSVIEYTIKREKKQPIYRHFLEKNTQKRRLGRRCTPCAYIKKDSAAQINSAAQMPRFFLNYEKEKRGLEYATTK
jgi:hypothetical protein